MQLYLANMTCVTGAGEESLRTPSQRVRLYIS